jgi:hypothetical protein
VAAPVDSTIFRRGKAPPLCRAAAKRYGRVLSMDRDMAKAISLFLLAVMIVQVIYPLGLPGLKTRGDFWKIALAAIFVMMLTVLIRPT